MIDDMPTIPNGLRRSPPDGYDAEKNGREGYALAISEMRKRLLAEQGKVPIADIAIGERHRKDLGDLKALASSIAEQGLLQPIGINEKMELVFGERRLRACRDILGLVEIEARIVEVTSLVEGEYAENEIRKAFMPSERVAIAEAIAQEIGNRQGERTDKSLPEKVREVGRHERETTTVAAKKAGFGNDRTFRQAKEIVENDWSARELKARINQTKATARIMSSEPSDGTCTVADLWTLAEQGGAS